MDGHWSTKFSPYLLLYEHDVLLPWEVEVGSRHVVFQEGLSANNFISLINDDLDDFNCHRLHVLVNIEANNLKVANHYNKKVKLREFHEWELVWKLVLPIGSKDSKYGKWLPNWEGLYRVS